MTVKELKSLLADAPDDLPIMVLVEDHTKPGMFAFAEACECDTGEGIIGIGDGDNNDAFLILPHGIGIKEEEMNKGDAITPVLN